METLLALVVGMAVIIFGALISLGNERQRRAIDDLREQVVLWALQDLRLKREKLVREVRIDDPLAWLNTVAAKIVGYNMRLQNVEFFESPAALVCVVGEDGTKAIFSPLSPQEVRLLRKQPRSRLNQNPQGNPLLSLPKGVVPYEISALTAGGMFDLELHLFWKSIAGQDVEQPRIWMYFLD